MEVVVTSDKPATQECDSCNDQEFHPGVQARLAIGLVAGLGIATVFTPATALLAIEWRVVAATVLIAVTCMFSARMKPKLPALPEPPVLETASAQQHAREASIQLGEGFDRAVFGWSTVLAIMHAAVLVQAVPFVLKNGDLAYAPQYLTLAALCFGVLSVLIVAANLAITSAADRSRRATHLLKHQADSSSFARYVDARGKDDLIAILVSVILKATAFAWAGLAGLLLLFALVFGIASQ